MDGVKEDTRPVVEEEEKKGGRGEGEMGADVWLRQRKNFFQKKRLGD